MAGPIEAVAPEQEKKDYAPACSLTLQLSLQQVYLQRFMVIHQINTVNSMSIFFFKKAIKFNNFILELYFFNQKTMKLLKKASIAMLNEANPQTPIIYIISTLSWPLSLCTTQPPICYKRGHNQALNITYTLPFSACSGATANLCTNLQHLCASRKTVSACPHRFMP